MIRKEHYAVAITSSESELEEEDEGKNTKVNEDEETRKMRQQLLELCDQPDLDKKRKSDAEKAVRVLNYVQTIQHRCTRLPAATSKEIDRYVDIV